MFEIGDGQPAAEVVWRDKARDAISPVNVQPFYDAESNVIYGMDQSGDMCALEMPTGKRLWADSTPVSKRRVGSGTAFIVRQADRFWLFNENGELIIAKLSPEKYEEIDRVKSDRAIQCRVWSRCRLEHAGVCQSVNLYPQRQRDHLPGSGKEVTFVNRVPNRNRRRGW